MTDEELELRFAILENNILDLSQQLAEKQYGWETVQEAYEAAAQHSELLESIKRMPHPWDALMRWHHGDMRIVEQHDPQPNDLKQ